MVEDRKGHDRRYSLDDSILRAAGYAPRIPLQTGCARRCSNTWKTESGGSC